MSDEAVRRVKKPKPKFSLDIGDTVEFSLTGEVKKQGGGTMWVKAGCTSTVRIGEAPSEAYSRVQDIVVDTVQGAVRDLS